MSEYLKGKSEYLQEREKRLAVEEIKIGTMGVLKVLNSYKKKFFVLGHR